MRGDAHDDDRFRRLAETLPQLVWMVGGDERVIYLNRHALDYYGLTAEQAYRFYVRDFITHFMHPDDQERVHEAWQRARRERALFEVEVRNRRGDGVYEWHLKRAAPLCDETGAILEWFGSSTDITAQKQVEAALQRSETHLERERDFRERLMAIVGHDLRNPLTAVASSADLLKESPTLSPLDARAIERIGRSVDRMLRMITQLTDFTRSRQGGGIRVEPAPLDLGHLCRDTLDELRLVHPEQRIELEVSGDLRGAWDPDRIAQVVSNLVANALEHGDGRAVLVQVVRLGGEVRLEVHNFGVPIPEDELPHLFDPYRRVRSPAGDAEAPAHLGLGLYIVEQIVQAHGGTITARSSAWDGTRFTVRLPRLSPEPLLEGSGELGVLVER